MMSSRYDDVSDGLRGEGGVVSLHISHPGFQGLGILVDLASSVVSCKELYLRST